MSERATHLLTLVGLTSVVLGCGSPSAPSVNPATTTLSINGQSAPVSNDFSGAFSRAPSGLNWIDINVGTCGGPGIGFTLEGVAFPLAPGVYAISPGFEFSELSAFARDFALQEWSAGSGLMANYCGREGVLPACDESSPGSGSVTLTTSSASRVAGSYRFMMTQHMNYQGPISERPPAPTKLFEGTFDLAFGNSVVCD